MALSIRKQHANITLKAKEAQIHGTWHHKFIIVDNNILMTGSFNCSAKAEKSNFENLLILKDKPTIMEYMKEFKEWWKVVQDPVAWKEKKRE